jgi:hypothetical protein
LKIPKALKTMKLSKNLSNGNRISRGMGLVSEDIVEDV